MRYKANYEIEKVSVYPDSKSMIVADRKFKNDKFTIEIAHGEITVYCHQNKKYIEYIPSGLIKFMSILENEVHNQGFTIDTDTDLLNN